MAVSAEIEAPWVQVRVSWKPEVTVEFSDGTTQTVDTGLEEVNGRIRFDRAALADAQRTNRGLRNETHGLLLQMAWRGAVRDEAYPSQLEAAVRRALAATVPEAKV